MTNLSSDIQNCTRCPLHKLMPLTCKPVPGVGPSKARLMIIGEALGEDEAIAGLPFQGKCGRMLNNMLRDAGIERDSVFITNVVKCRPLKGKANRPPTKDEISKCSIHLSRELYEQNPKVVFTLGKIPTYEILDDLKASFKLGDVVGKEYKTVIDWGGEPPDESRFITVPVYHPSYVMVHSRSDYDTCVEIFRRYK